MYGFGESFKFGLCAGDKDNVEATLRKLYGEFFAYAVRSTSYDGPAGTGSECTEL